jgi:VanZ family protein
LSFLLYFTLIFQRKSTTLKNNAFIFTILFVILYGILDEVHQLLIPGRSCEFLDFLADMVGVVIGMILMKFFTKVYKFQEESIS